jgi:hypothetical protein
MDRSGNDPKEYLIQLRQAIAAYLPTRGLPLIGAWRWTDRLLVTAAILLAFVGGATMIDRFTGARAAVVAMYRSRKRPGKSFAGFMAALARRSPRLVALIGATLRGKMQARLAAHWRVGRFAAFGFDGTKIDCPRTKANEKHFKIGGRHKSGPQMLLGMLFHLRTGLIWSWRRGEACTPERTLLRDLLGDLPAASLLVADAGLTGYELLSAILAAGHAFVIRVGANVTLLQELGYLVEERHGIVYLWSRRAQAEGLPPLALRLIVLHDGRNRKWCLLTNVLDPQELSTAQARQLYKLRWGVELLFRAMKQTLARRKMLSTSPGHAEVELDWTVIGQWLLSQLWFERRGEKTAVAQGFAAALRIVRRAMAGQADGRQSLWRTLGRIRPDRYRRRRPKKARAWAHKKNDPPCGTPKLRIATPTEKRMASGFCELKRAA